MKINQAQEWREWIWIGIFLFVSIVTAGFGLYAKAQSYTDEEIEKAEQSLAEDIKEMRHEIREDLHIIRLDIKQLLQKQNRQ